MRKSFKTGVSFGLTSGVITTLGLIVGLHSGTHSQLAVIGGILTIAIADAFSDALGIHICEESEGTHSKRHIWESTAFTFLSKLIFALTFLIPVIVFELSTAILVSIVWGMSVLVIFSYSMAKSQGTQPWEVVIEHLIITIIVIGITHILGNWISTAFK
jgi:VIT1/CCC1 family predicted Fe2+/Mn2+ transporter